MREIFESYGLNLSIEEEKKFTRYLELLVEWNQKMNLTSITESNEIIVKHFIDSLLLTKFFNIPKNARVIDVGTGAGFPGVPLKIIRPDVNLTLLDSLQKRLNFLKSLILELNIEANLVHARAEDAGHNINFREKFDVVTARAVAPLNILLEYCVPFVRNDGYFVALKGRNVDEELKCSENAIKVLNIELVDFQKVNLIDDNDRSILIFHKKMSIKDIYPRNSAKIKRNSL